MSEHVEDKELLFRRLAEYTREGGLLLLHSIMCPVPVEKRQDSTSWSWLKESIFPVGMVRPLGYHVAGLEAESFEILDVETLTDHYARTCALWLRKLEAAEEEIVAEGVASRETAVQPQALPRGERQVLRGEPQPHLPGAGAAVRPVLGAPEAPPDAAATWS